MAKIYAPNKEYTGISASVPFVMGKGETDDPHLIQWFKDHGYEVVEETAEPDQDEIQDEAEAVLENLPEFVSEEEPEPVKKSTSKKRGGK